MLQWVATGAALLVAAFALLRARRTAKRLDRLSESYWELRYETGQLRSQIARLEGRPDGADPGAPPEAGRGGSTVFVPLSSLKR
jgi:hypothetical protein